MHILNLLVVFFEGNLLEWELEGRGGGDFIVWEAIFLGGNYFRGSFSGGYFPRRQLSLRTIVWKGNHSGAIFRGGKFEVFL